jgi:hypothetical protein
MHLRALDRFEGAAAQFSDLRFRAQVAKAQLRFIPASIFTELNCDRT